MIFSETVIAKMCSVVTDSSRMSEEGLAALTEFSSRSLLVEAYDTILIDESVPQASCVAWTGLLQSPILILMPY